MLLRKPEDNSHSFVYRITSMLSVCRQSFKNNGITALYCSGIGFDIQNFPIVLNRLDHCKIETTYSREIEANALCFETEIGFGC